MSFSSIASIGAITLRSRYQKSLIVHKPFIEQDNDTCFGTGPQEKFFLSSRATKSNILVSKVYFHLPLNVSNAAFQVNADIKNRFLTTCRLPAVAIGGVSDKSLEADHLVFFRCIPIHYILEVDHQCFEVNVCSAAVYVQPADERQRTYNTNVQSKKDCSHFCLVFTGRSFDTREMPLVAVSSLFPRKNSTEKHERQ